MNIILAGIMGRYPYGGVAWCSLMYLHGLMQLGHNVWYLEDMAECNFDPLRNALSKDPRYALNFIRSSLEPFGLQDRWCYIDWKQDYHGYTRQAWLDVCSNADLFLNLSGGSWLWRDEYASIPHSAYIDTDPAFTQLEAARRPDLLQFLSRYGSLFTFGRNIGTPSSPVPTNGLHWQHTWQPVALDLWTPSPDPPRPTLTTVMSWKIDSFEQIGGNKDQEFSRFIDLPRHVSTPLELAVSGPPAVLPQLRAYGWVCRDAFSISHTPQSYLHYIRSSLGEFSVAKHTYVATNSAWFSDRTECYLASGRPAVVQDTGFSSHLPNGHGLLSFTTFDQARAAIDQLSADYPRHASAARDLAASHFSCEVVLPPLIERATSPLPQERPA